MYRTLSYVIKPEKRTEKPITRICSIWCNVLFPVMRYSGSENARRQTVRIVSPTNASIQYLAINLPFIIFLIYLAANDHAQGRGVRWKLKPKSGFYRVAWSILFWGLSYFDLFCSIAAVFIAFTVIAAFYSFSLRFSILQILPPNNSHKLPKSPYASHGSMKTTITVTMPWAE